MTTLLVPDVGRGHGTGHLRRCAALARSISDSVLLIPDEGNDTSRGRHELNDLLEGIEERRIVSSVPGEVGKVIIDSFRASRSEVESFGRALTIGVDLGGEARDWCSFLVDILPRIDSAPANVSDPGYLDLPDYLPPSDDSTGRILLTFGGEDPARLTESTARALVDDVGVHSRNITVVRPGLRSLETMPPGLNTVGPLPSLEGLLAEHEWVITAFGLTALEADAAGRRVITVAPSNYHDKLAKRAGFARAGIRHPDSRDLASCLNQAPGPSRAERLTGTGGHHRSLAELIESLSVSRTGCPAHHESRGNAVWRGADKTYFVCPVCGMTYMERFAADEETYGPSYFEGEYRAQYGRTYLEDFDSIKRMGQRRVAQIRALLPQARTILDVGCAFGPFMAAAAESGMEPFGVDVSESGVNHVTSTLGLAARVGQVPQFDVALFGRRNFDAVALWYVVEHFADLDSVMRALSRWVRPGGILAVGTPYLHGVSGRRNTAEFMRASPRDHFTIWSRSSAAKLLGQYGFRVRRFVSTGHHPERYPAVKRGLVPRPLAAAHSRMFGWGDTFEIYAQRTTGG